MELVRHRLGYSSINSRGQGRRLLYPHPKVQVFYVPTGACFMPLELSLVLTRHGHLGAFSANIKSILLLHPSLSLVLGMTSCPQGRCSDCHLPDSSTFSPNMQVRKRRTGTGASVSPASKDIWDPAPELPPVESFPTVGETSMERTHNLMPPELLVVPGKAWQDRTFSRDQRFPGLRHPGQWLDLSLGG